MLNVVGGEKSGKSWLENWKRRESGGDFRLREIG